MNPTFFTWLIALVLTALTGCKGAPDFPAPGHPMYGDCKNCEQMLLCPEMHVIPTGDGHYVSRPIFTNGVCAAADENRLCGVIDRDARWVVEPRYKNVKMLEEDILCESPGVSVLYGYDGGVINPSIVGDVIRLTFKGAPLTDGRRYSTDCAPWKEVLAMKVYCDGGTRSNAEIVAHVLLDHA